MPATIVLLAVRETGGRGILQVEEALVSVNSISPGFLPVGLQPCVWPGDAQGSVPLRRADLSQGSFLDLSDRCPQSSLS